MRHEHLLGLGALERAERFPVPEDASVVALVEVAAAAEEAVAAGGEVAAEHTVALAHLSHAISRGDHRADELVPSVKPGSICTRPW